MDGPPREKIAPFKKFYDLDDFAWLTSAITNINEQYDSLLLSEDDFEELPKIEWEPLPLDRQNEDFPKLVAAFDEAINTIEADNGYSVHAPAERDVVVSSLKSFRQVLTENAH